MTAYDTLCDQLATQPRTWLFDDGSLQAWADETQRLDQLQSALGNLVENAVKYSEPGSSVQVRVRVEGSLNMFTTVKPLSVGTCLMRRSSRTG